MKEIIKSIGATAGGLLGLLVMLSFPIWIGLAIQLIWPPPLQSDLTPEQEEQQFNEIMTETFRKMCEEPDGTRPAEFCGQLILDDD